MAKKQHTKDTKLAILKAMKESGHALKLVLNAYDAANYNNDGIVETVKDEESSLTVDWKAERAAKAKSEVVSVAATAISMNHPALMHYMECIKVADRADFLAAVEKDIIIPILAQLQVIFNNIDKL